MLVTGSSRDRFPGDRINNYAFHMLFLFYFCIVLAFAPFGTAVHFVSWLLLLFCFLLLLCCRMKHTLKQYNCPRSENKIKIQKRVKRTTFNRTAQTMLLAPQGREHAMKARQLHRPTTGTGQFRIVTSSVLLPNSHLTSQTDRVSA